MWPFIPSMANQKNGRQTKTLSLSSVAAARLAASRLAKTAAFAGAGL
jgi:hypothetical protein